MVQLADITIDPTPLSLLSAPLDWFVAEHQRHRRVCHLLTDVAGMREFDGPLIAALAAYIRHDLTLHILDEELDFFPLLRRRARADEQIDEALGRLAAEHSLDASGAQTVLAHLEACLEARAAPGATPGARKALQDFAQDELRHLALENAVVLPLARLRLTPADLRKLAHKLAARRGLKLQGKAVA